VRLAVQRFVVVVALLITLLGALTGLANALRKLLEAWDWFRRP
jgi:hypothetical protein